MFLENGDQYWELSNAYTTDAWFQILMLISGFSSIFFFLIVWFTKELQVHPMRIFMLMSFADGICFFAIAASYKICEYRLNELLALTLFFKTDIKSVYRAT